MSKGGETGQGLQTGTTATNVQAPAFVQDQMQRTFAAADNFRPDVYGGDRVAPMNADQMAFFDRARNYSQQPFAAPTIDTSQLQGMMGQTIDTSGLQGTAYRTADMSGLQGLAGQRADTAALQQAQQASADRSGLAGLMGQQNQAAGIIEGMTNREVTPYLDTAVNAASDNALQGVMARYAASGRLGSQAFADSAAQGVTNAAAPILQQAAQADAARQQQAAGMLANIYGQDMSRDVGLAQSQVNAELADLGRQGQLSGLMAQLSDRGLSRDAQIQNQIAGFDNQNINRQVAAEQAMMAAQQADYARNAGIAGQLAGLSAEQARMAPMVEQINLNRMGLLGSIGDAQQQYNQAQLMGQQQQVAEYNQARQQQIQNMLAAQGLGGNYLGESTTTYDPDKRFKQALGVGSVVAGFIPGGGS